MTMQRHHGASSRRRIIRIWPVWLCAIALVGACSSETDSGSSGSSGTTPIPLSVSVEDYCGRYADILCDAARECSCLFGATEKRCVSFHTGLCLENIEEPVLDGRMSYDAGEAGNCLRAIETLIADCSLEGDDHHPASCDDMVVGLLDAGSPCVDDMHCRPGLECPEETCLEMPAVGQPCLEPGFCASDNYCGEDLLCHGFLGPGGPCAADLDAFCDDDLYCGDAGTCERLVADGGSCTGIEQCLNGECIDGLCVNVDGDEDDCGLL